eukprot:TRINITY_DN1342_c0_g1_i1.p1 TRINITY_DN1342_c0_g1~~TRINITY_DN1342_c0_g1_i1.p1  ORF type:complete len:644 (+),score=35.78 TRINITY_DN1342_c0_g1_i1:327-2258(+)
MGLHVHKMHLVAQILWFRSWKVPPSPALFNGSYSWTCGDSIPGTFSFSCSSTRITYMRIEKGYANTTIPASVASLPWTEVGLLGVGLYGTIPAELFNPNFRVLNAPENMFWGSVPDSILNATNLEEMILSSNVLDSLPSNLSALGPSFRGTSLTGNNIKCLPAFSQLLNIQSRNATFRVGDNEIDFDNTAACPTTAEIAANRYSLARATFEPALKMYSSYAAPTTWDFNVTSPVLPRSEVRVKDSRIYFFSRERNGAAYLKEYFGIEMPLIHLIAIEKIPTENDEYHVKTYKLDRFSSGSLSSDGKFFTLTASLTPEHPGNESIVEFILNLAPFAGENPPNPADGSAVKYSLRLSKWYWPTYNQRIPGSTIEFRLFGQLQLILRTPHSTSDSVILCQGVSNVLPGFGDSGIEIGNSTCRSRHLELTAYLDRSSGTPAGVIEFKALSGRLSVVYSSVPLYTYDGNFDVLSPRNPSLHLFPLDVFGPSRGMATHNLPGSPLTPRVATYTQNGDWQNEEALLYLLPLGVKQFFQVLEIDPTVSLTLAFGADDPDPSPSTRSPAAPGTIDNASTYSTVGIAVGLSVTAAVLLVVAIVLLVPSIRAKVFPFLKKREESDMLPKEDIDDHSPDTPLRDTKGGGWVQGKV